SYLNTTVTSPTFAHLHDKARHFVESVAGKSVAEFAHKVEESVKGLLVPSVIFEELGLRYYGPIDGHDIPLLIRTFEFLKTQEEPVLLHILTQKGKGYAPALKQPDKFHGLGKYKIESGETAPTPTPTYSEIFGKTHHGLFDIGYLRHVPNWVHMQPKDEDEFVDMLWTMLHYNSGPIAIRYPRGSGTGAKIKPEPKLLEIGKAEVVQHGRDVAIFGLGAMFEVAQEAARKLEEKGISVALINPRWIKPMDTGTLEFFARSVEVVCTIEDHVLHN